MKKLLLLVMVLGLVGCEPPSMNVQRSAARDAGDTGITIYLDGRNVHDLDEKKARILAIAIEIEEFLNTGEVSELTVGALKKQVNKIVPAEYQNLSDTVLEYLSEYSIPTDKVPAEVVKNIKAALYGIRTGVAEYRIEDRKPEKPKEEPEVSG